MRRSLLPLCLGAALLAALPVRSQGAPAVGPDAPATATPPGFGPAILLELTDSTLIAGAWTAIFPDSARPRGEYAILIPDPTGSAPGNPDQGKVILLRNGTEAGRLDIATWNALATASGKNGDPAWVTAAEGPENPEVPTLWHAVRFDGESLLRWAEWPSGFTFGIGSSISAVRTSKPQYQRDVDFSWNQKVFTHFLIGGELHRSQFGGGLARLGRTVAEPETGGTAGSGTPDFWSDGYWWWSLSAGIPGIRYTLSLADQPLPRYYWLEPMPSIAIREHRNGKLVTQWNGPTLERSGNFAHTAEARLGVLRYGLHWDSDAYRIPVQTVGLDDLPALFGRWGGGLILASNILATRFWVDIPDLALTLGHPEAWPTRFRIAFLHLDLAYRNSGNFSLGVSLRVRVDNPIMNRPGA